jgi:hypothetical protein
MAETEFSPRLRAFVREFVTSPEQLDVLVLLRENRSKEWTAEEVGKALSIVREVASMRLFLFSRGGLLGFRGGSETVYWFEPKPDLADLADELGEAWTSRRAAMLELVTGKPAEPVQSFADAFKLKKGD